MIEPPHRPTARKPIAVWRGWIAAMLCTIAFSAGAAAQTTPGSIPARGGLHEDFGRLVIDFPAAVATDISGEGARIELRFDGAADIDLKSAAATLREYVAGARLSPDKRRLTLDFTAPVTWQAFNSGAKLALDFAFAGDARQREFDHGPAAADRRVTTAGTAQPAATSAGAPATVRLRTGEHPGFSRLAFDWPKDVAYTVRQDGAQAELRFDSVGAIDLEKIAGDLPPRLNGVSTATAAGSVTVKLALKPGMVLRDFRAGRTVVLDIYDRSAANLPQAEQALLDVPPDVAMGEPQPAQPQTAAPQSAQPQSAQPQSAEPEPAQQAAVAPDLTPQLQSAMPEAPAPQPQPAAAGASGPGVATPVTAQPPTTFEPPRVPPPAVTVKVTALPQADGAELFFDWPKPVALAVFRRGDALWLAFDAPGKADLKPLAGLEPVIGKAELVPSSFSFALRLTGGTAAAPLTETEGARWKVTLRPGQAMAPAQPLQQRRETLANGGSSLYVQAIASGAAVDLEDPADRGKLVVTPGQIAGAGVAQQSDWPDFKLLPSYQGVVVALLNDRPKVQAGPNGVIVTAPPRAAVAATAPPAETQAQPEPEAEAGEESAEAEGAPQAGPPPPIVTSVPKALPTTASLFDMKAWRRGGPATFAVDRAALESREKSASPADRTRARLDLAQFLLANGYFPEAGRYINDILADDRSAAGNPLIMAIGAAARTMQGDTDQARRMLASPALQGVPEADLMTAFIAAQRGDAETAARLFGGPLPDISEYPKTFRTRARLLAARALLENGDPLTAQNYIDPLMEDDPDTETQARAAFLDGLRQQSIGQEQEALATWATLTESPIDEIRARAQFAVVSQQLDDKKIEPKDAVGKLEALRYLWRGDTFEFDLLTKLGHLYFDVAEPRKGLITLRQAATHFPDHPKAKQAADEMTGEFRKLYLGGGADALSPLTAVALYDEFRELTPPGPDGDRMIAALADRLVKVDLLDRAGDLLERQVKTRLSGADKVAAGTRMAAVRLLDNKPERALQALGDTEIPAATAPELQAQRQRLRARALFDTGETLKGLGLIERDDSLEGLWLKSDMYWKLREWPTAADALGRLIAAEQAKRQAAAQGPAPDDISANPASVLDKALADAEAADAADPASAPDAAAQPASKPLLDPVLSRLVLNRAVALSLANDRRGMKELGRSFGKQMDTTPLAQPFRVLTSPDSGITESIDAQLKSVDQLGVFVEEYRKILQSEALSTNTDPAETGPMAPMDPPEDTSGERAPAPASEQTAGQPSAQPAVQ